MTVSVKKKFDNIDDGIANMIAAAIYDYNNWSRNEASEEMKKEFADGFVVKKEDVDFCINCGELVFKETLNENLKKWFKDKWVRMGPGGKIRGSCGGKSKGEGKPK